MGAAKKVRTTKTAKQTKLTLVKEGPIQQSFDFSVKVKEKKPVAKKASVVEKTIVDNVVIISAKLVQDKGPVNTLDFEGSYNEEDILSVKLFEKFSRFKVLESTSAKFAKSSVASTFINDQTVEEFIPWAIMKGIEKWRQHKMIKEYEILTAPMDENVVEIYHAKMKREDRIREIARYFETSVDKQSSLMVFTEFNQIWNYCFTTFNSKIRNIYRDTVKAKNNDEYIDYHTIEDCLELNADYSDYFAKNDNRVKSARDVLEILSSRVEQLNPAKADLYKKVFKVHFIEDRDMAETCTLLKIPRHTVSSIKKDIERLIVTLKESYTDYLEAA